MYEKLLGFGNNLFFIQMIFVNKDGWYYLVITVQDGWAILFILTSILC